MTEDYIKTRSNLKHVFLLIDYRHKPTDDDILMYDFLKYYNLKTTIIATKFDKVTKTSRDKQNKLIRDAFKLGENDHFIAFSSLTKTGRDEALEIISSYI